MSREGDGADVPGKDSGGGTEGTGDRGDDVGSSSIRPVQQSAQEYYGPASEWHDCTAGRSLGNVHSEQGGLESHTEELRGSTEQLPDRLELSVQKVYVVDINFI